MRLLVILSLLINGIIFTGCSISTNMPDYDSSKEYGFSAAEGDRLQNPPEGKTRIYVFTRNKISLDDFYYNITIDYSPRFIGNELNPRTKRDFLFRVRDNFIYYKDIDAVNKEIALHASADKFQQNIVFTPKPNQIYCLWAYRSGNLWAPPKPYMVLVDKEVCYRETEKLKLNKRSQYTWEQDKEEYDKQHNIQYQIIKNVIDMF